MKIVRKITEFKLEEHEVDKIRGFVDVLEEVCDEWTQENGCSNCPFYKIGVCDSGRVDDLTNMVGNLYNMNYVDE